jgi:hypothetical protein
VPSSSRPARPSSRPNSPARSISVGTPNAAPTPRQRRGGRQNPQARSQALATAADAALDAENTHVPALPRLVADDVTPEAAASLLAEQGGRLAVLSAEGGIFATMAGRYSGGVPSLEVFLKGHAGDLLRVDRSRDSATVAAFTKDLTGTAGPRSGSATPVRT